MVGSPTTPTRRFAWAMVATSMLIGAGLIGGRSLVSRSVDGSFAGWVSAAPSAQGEASCRWRVLERGPTRTQHTLVALPGADLVAFAGGERAAGQATVLADLQRLRGSDGQGAWSAMTATGAGPAARAQHVSVVHDEPGGDATMITYGGVDELVSFGGGGGGTFTWRSPLVAGGASAAGRRGAFAPLGLVGDAFTLAITQGGASWSPLSIPGRPLADAAAVWWPSAESMVVIGGRLSEEATSATGARQLISLGGSEPSVEVVEDPGGPAPRYALSAVFDSERERLLIFGGTRNWQNGRNDVWSLDLSRGWGDATWTPVDAFGRPPARRFDHVAAWHPGLNAMLVFGGTRNGSDSLDDLWALDMSGERPTWRELDPEGPTPAGVAGAAAAWSDGAEAMILYGGTTGSTSQRDAWALDCSVTGGPSPTVPVPTVPVPATPTPGATATRPAPSGAIHLPWGQR